MYLTVEDKHEIFSTATVNLTSKPITHYFKKFVTTAFISQVSDTKKSCSQYTYSSKVISISVMLIQYKDVTLMFTHMYCGNNTYRQRGHFTSTIQYLSRCICIIHVKLPNHRNMHRFAIANLTA